MSNMLRRYAIICTAACIFLMFLEWTYLRRYFRYNTRDMTIRTATELVDLQTGGNWINNAPIKYSKDHIVRKSSIFKKLPHNIQLYIGIAHVKSTWKSEEQLIGNLGPHLAPGSFSGQKIADNCRHFRESDFGGSIKDKMLICDADGYLYRVSIKYTNDTMKYHSDEDLQRMCEDYAIIVSKAIADSKSMSALLSHGSFIMDSFFGFTPKGI